MPVPVLFLTDLLDVGGAETQLVALLHALDPQRVRPLLAILRGEGALAPTVRVPLTPIRMGGPLDVRALARVRELIEREGVQAIYTTHVRSALMARLLRLLVHPPRPQRRLIVLTSEHSYKTPPARPLPEILRRSSARLSDRIIAISEVQATWLRQTLRLPPSRVVVIPNGVDTDHFAQPVPAAPVLQEFGIGAGEPVFVCIARLAAVKDHATLFMALRQVGGHLILVGAGPLRAQLERAATEMDLARRVHFAGERADVRPFLAAAWALCLSSIDESQPIAILEAMAASRPVVATRVGGIPEMLEDGRTGLFAPARDADALAGAMRRVVADAAWRARAGEAARARVIRDYSIQSRARRIEAMIEDLVARG